VATVHGQEASYKIRGNEGYVRARVTDSNGRQPGRRRFSLENPNREPSEAGV
jgi:hypothetical protein